MAEDVPASPRNINTDARLVIRGALIAAIAALGGALIGSYATLTTQRDQAHEIRLAEARMRRATAYTAFLSRAGTFAARARLADAANQNADKQSFRKTFDACLNNADDLADFLSAKCGSFLEKLAFTILGPCDQRPALCHLLHAVFPTVFSDREGFQAALNDVYIYGSRDGLDAAKKVAKVLPDGDTINPRQFKKFQQRYGTFRKVMCRELNPDPRPNC